MPEPALDALDARLRGTASARADHSLRAAQHEAEARLAEARAQAAALVDRARQDGDAVVDALLVRERATLRRSTVRTLLAAQRAVVDDLDARVRAAVLELRCAPDYSFLVDGLTTRARAQLGEDAVVIADPPDLGGVVAETEGRRVDYTLAALAVRALADLGAEVERLVR